MNQPDLYVWANVDTDKYHNLSLDQNELIVWYGVGSSILCLVNTVTFICTLGTLLIITQSQQYAQLCSIWSWLCLTGCGFLLPSTQ